MTDNEILELLILQGGKYVPEWAEQIAQAYARLSMVVFLGGGSVVDGAHAMADWIDARVACRVYAELMDPER